MRLKDKVAIITGGNRGIGKGIALEFAKEGAKVIIIGRDVAELKKTAGEINSIGSESLYYTGDVTNSKQIERNVKESFHKFGKIDILVNNSGIYLEGNAETTDENSWDKVVDIDLKGVWICSKACLPYMTEAGYGRIINISSLAGLIAADVSLAYCAAKGGVINLTREMAIDYAKKGIIVNGIAPGYIETEMTADYLSNEKVRKDLEDFTPAAGAIIAFSMLQRLGLIKQDGNVN